MFIGACGSEYIFKNKMVVSLLLVCLYVNDDCGVGENSENSVTVCCGFCGGRARIVGGISNPVTSI